MAAGKVFASNSLEVVKDADDSSDREQYYDVYVQQAGEDMYEEGTVDPVYQAKTQVRPDSAANMRARLTKTDPASEVFVLQDGSR